MSPEDINAQAGRALKDYQDAKVAFGQSEELLKAVADTYQKAAQCLRAKDSRQQVIQAFQAKRFEEDGSQLGIPDGRRFMQLLDEYASNKNRVLETRQTLQRLGFNVE